MANLSHFNEVLCIIPARGGSKSLPRKNIMLLQGKPLIAYSIEVALRAANISRVIVSTDDEEISTVAGHYGAEVPFLRPAAFAEDRSDVNQAISYTLAELARRGMAAHRVVILYPTHPFRSVTMVEKCVAILQQGYRQVLSVKKISSRDQALYYCDTHGLRPLLDIDAPDMAIPYYRASGIFQGVNRQPAWSPLYHRRFLYPIENVFSLIDIDTPLDFQMAEEIIVNHLFDFGL